jgi:hypothetical protein
MLRKRERQKDEGTNRGIHADSNTHCKEIRIYVFPEKELRSLTPNFNIHVSVSDLYIPTRSANLFSCSRIGRPIRGIYKSLTDT